METKHQLPPKNSPWGIPDHYTPVADGIVFVSTPSHGGYWLSPERERELKQELPGIHTWGRSTEWFEEDCDWAYVALMWPEYFPKEAFPAALGVLNGVLYMKENPAVIQLMNKRIKEMQDIA